MTEHKIEKEHALKIIRAMRTNWDENSKTPNAHALDMAAEALEKQIPIKPIGKTNICPKCGVIEFGFNEPNYCEWCGQKLKWE